MSPPRLSFRPLQCLQNWPAPRPSCLPPRLAGRVTPSRTMALAVRAAAGPGATDGGLPPPQPAGAGPVTDNPAAGLTSTQARPVPGSPSYFSRHPVFNDRFVQLEKLLTRHEHLPTARPERLPRALWRTAKNYRTSSGEQVKASQFSVAMRIVRRLYQIHPSIRPAEVTEALDPFRRDVEGVQDVTKILPIDRFGRAVGVGKRKTSVARAWVLPGTGEVQVNGKTLAGMFSRVHDRENAVWPLRVTGRMDKYNVWALVHGGGTTGQSEALTLAVAKGLMAHEPGLKPALRRGGCVTRDPREVERKKAGRIKARKMTSWNAR